MFKVLLAASVAMLVCCAAAAWAGPVEPVSDRLRSIPVASSPAFSPMDLIDVPPVASHDSLLAAMVAEGSVPVSAFPAASSMSLPLDDGLRTADDLAPLDPDTRPAVIPLPPPLYGALALLAFVLFIRRAVLRAC